MDGWREMVEKEKSGKNFSMVETGSLRSLNAILQSVGDQQSFRSGKKGSQYNQILRWVRVGMNTIVAIWEKLWSAALYTCTWITKVNLRILHIRGT